MVEEIFWEWFVRPIFSREERDLKVCSKYGEDTVNTERIQNQWYMCEREWLDIWYSLVLDKK